VTKQQWLTLHAMKARIRHYLESGTDGPPLTDAEVDAFLASTDEPKEPTPHENA